MPRNAFLTLLIAALPLLAPAQLRYTKAKLDSARYVQAIRTITPDAALFQRVTLPRLPQPVEVDMAARHMPFFCRQELKMEKQSGLPLRIRLGSVQQTDWLEQKPGAVWPP